MEAPSKEINLPLPCDEPVIKRKLVTHNSSGGIGECNV